MTNRVLIVEDNPMLATFLSILVEDELGCTVLSAPSIGKARQLVEAGIDFALLDVEVEDGITYELAQEILESNIPVIFVSATEPGQLPDEIARTPFLKKPFLDSELLSVARRLMPSVTKHGSH